MRNTYRLMSLLAIPLFFIRVVDLISNHNAETGFMDGGSRVFRLICILVLLAAFFVFRALAGKKKEDLKSVGTLRADSAVMLAVTGVLYLMASMIQLLDVLETAPFRDIFRDGRTLLREGYTSAHFRFEFWCALAGITVSAWFFWMAVCGFSHKKLSENRPALQLFPGIWFAVRVLTVFTENPLNFYDSARLFGLFSDVLLGLAYVNAARFYALGCGAEDGKNLAGWSLTALLVTIGFHAPSLMVISADSAQTLYVAGDVLAAIGIFMIADHQMKGAYEDETAEDG